MGTYSFQPWAAGGRASIDQDSKTVTGTMALRADLGLRIARAEIVDGTFLVLTFEHVPAPDPEQET